MEIDGIERRPVVWDDWAITTRVDCRPYWQTVWEAVRYHRSKFPNLHILERLSGEPRAALWGRQAYDRAFSLVNGGRAPETGLFAGLRPG